MDQQTNPKLELVSALADGQLQGGALAQALDEVGTHADLRSAWQTYHLVGDVLRTGAHAPCSDSSAFLAKLQLRLTQEVVVAPVPATQSLPAVGDVRRRTEPANEPVFRWKLVAGAASLAAVAAISWNWVGGLSTAPSGAQLAQIASPAPISVLAASDPTATNAVASAVPTRVQIGAGAPQVMLRDARLDELLSAHQQAGGASQMPSTFLRNATFEGPSR
ncbi:MAG: anti-sigma factor [Comamonadaceae bacterium]|nr:MAG: anti-sigma factor [Comamonadaceae bacterium]